MEEISYVAYYRTGFHTVAYEMDGHFISMVGTNRELSTLRAGLKETFQFITGSVAVRNSNDD